MGTWEECANCKGVGTTTVVCPVCDGKGSWKQKRRGFTFTIDCPHCEIGTRYTRHLGNITKICVSCRGKQGIFNADEQDLENKSKIQQAWVECEEILSYEKDELEFLEQWDDYYSAFRRILNSEEVTDKKRALDQVHSRLESHFTRFGWNPKLTAYGEYGWCDKYLLDPQGTLEVIQTLRSEAKAYSAFLCKQLDYEGIPYI